MYKVDFVWFCVVNLELYGMIEDFESCYILWCLDVWCWNYYVNVEVNWFWGWKVC